VLLLEGLCRIYIRYLNIMISEDDSVTVLELAHTVLKAILQSKTGSSLYINDADIYEQINVAIDAIEYTISKQ
jgi:hypothetical protein